MPSAASLLPPLLHPAAAGAVCRDNPHCGKDGGGGVFRSGRSRGVDLRCRRQRRHLSRLPDTASSTPPRTCRRRQRSKRDGLSRRVGLRPSLPPRALCPTAAHSLLQEEGTYPAPSRPDLDAVTGAGASPMAPLSVVEHLGAVARILVGHLGSPSRRP